MSEHEAIIGELIETLFSAYDMLDDNQKMALLMKVKQPMLSEALNRQWKLSERKEI